jgi:hypothetical protein
MRREVLGLKVADVSGKLGVEQARMWLILFLRRGRLLPPGWRLGGGQCGAAAFDQGDESISGGCGELFEEAAGPLGLDAVERRGGTESEVEAGVAGGPFEDRITIESLGGQEIWLPLIDSLRLARISHSRIVDLGELGRRK